MPRGLQPDCWRWRWANNLKLVRNPVMFESMFELESMFESMFELEFESMFELESACKTETVAMKCQSASSKACAVGNLQ